MPDDEEPQGKQSAVSKTAIEAWDKVAMAVSSTLFPPWHTKGWSDRHVQGALWILSASIAISALARVLAASRPWELDLVSLRSVLSAVIPAGAAFIVGLFSLRRPEQQWRKYFIYVSVSWMIILVLYIIILYLVTFGYNIFAFINNVVPNTVLNVISAEAIVLGITSAVCNGFLYLRFRYQGLLVKEPRGWVIIAYILSVAMFSTAGWLAIYSDFMA